MYYTTSWPSHHVVVVVVIVVALSSVHLHCASWDAASALGQCIPSLDYCQECTNLNREAGPPSPLRRSDGNMKQVDEGNIVIVLLSVLTV